MSGFTGPSALIVIQENNATFWTDSRFFAQAKRELDNNTWTIIKWGNSFEPTLEEYLVNSLQANSRVGIDPFLIKGKLFHTLYEYLDQAGSKLVSIQTNLVDNVWKNRPQPKLLDLEPIDPQYSGKIFDFLLFYIAFNNKICIINSTERM